MEDMCVPNVLEQQKIRWADIDFDWDLFKTSLLPFLGFKKLEIAPSTGIVYVATET